MFRCHAIAAFVLLGFSAILSAQQPAAPAATPAAAPPPPPITQAEKDAFRKELTSFYQLQAKYANEMLQLKQQMEDVTKKSNEELTPKGQKVQQLFGALSSRCAAPKRFDLEEADCVEAKPEKK